MKKLLMMTTAIAGVALLSTPASAAIDLDLGGYFRGYVVDADNDLTAVREQEFRRATELHVSGETTLDNGLTVGAYSEFQVANGNDGFVTDEVYAYFSGGWGRVNLGDEDGAAYLLQVTAPSADSNVDGFDVTISGLDLTTGTGIEGTDVVGTKAFENGDILEYAHQDFENADRLTYMTPKYMGFQAGVSYTFSPEIVSMAGALDEPDNEAGEYEDAMEVALRYDGEYQGFAFGLGAGYSTVDLEAEDTVNGALAAANTNVLSQTDGVDTYNLGASVMFQNFSLGASYKVAETQFTMDTDVDGGTDAFVTSDFDNKTYVIGAAYDNGPYHVGLSYLNQELERDVIDAVTDADANDVAFDGATKEIDRFTLGGGYSFGPGITFRGSVSWGEVESRVNDATALASGGTNITFDGDSNTTRDFTQVTLGTDVKF